MTEVGQKMKSLGWITGTESNRQDAWYNWTSKGKALFPSFISEMRKLADVFNAQDVEFIRQHVFYLGIKTKSRKEVLFEDLRDIFDRAGNEDLVAESRDARKTFSRLQIFDLVEWVYQHNATDVRICRLGGAGENPDVVMKMPAGVYQNDC